MPDEISSVPVRSFILIFPTERNGAEFNRCSITERKRDFRSVRFDQVTVGRFPQNCNYHFRPKVDFQAERFKLLTIPSVPSEKASLSFFKFDQQ
uniref:Uncharacterized protein n=1 Tax=Romanomermis culicivorax TaxID=13658 RepID=A0A915JAZ7_ROMCU